LGCARIEGCLEAFIHSAALADRISSSLKARNFHEPRIGPVENGQHCPLAGKIARGAVGIVNPYRAGVADDVGNLDRLNPWFCLMVSLSGGGLLLFMIGFLDIGKVPRPLAPRSARNVGR
jgi:hypothetical protein